MPFSVRAGLPTFMMTSQSGKSRSDLTAPLLLVSVQFPGLTLASFVQVGRQRSVRAHELMQNLQPQVGRLTYAGSAV